MSHARLVPKVDNLKTELAISNRYERSAEDIRFEQRVLSAYGALCKHFCYTQPIDVLHQNWDRTSRQAAIKNLVEAQSLYFQPESVNDRNTILMVNANGRGIGHLEPHTAENILGTLRNGLEWRAHVRRVFYAEETRTWNVVIMLLSMITPEEYAQLTVDRKMLKDYSVEWTLIAVILLGVALTIL